MSNINNSKILKQIVAIGGGGFSDAGKLTPLDKYILSIAKSKYPKICFLPTASGDSERYTDRFYHSFSNADCLLSHYSIFRSNHKNIESFLLEQDIIYVGGGNTYNMLALWKARGIDKILKKAYENGVILAGISAGSLCWFKAGNTDSFGEMDKIECLGLLEYSNSPHYNSEISRRPNFQHLIQTNQIPSGYAVDEQVAIHFVDGEVHNVVKESSEDRNAYYVSLENNELIEKKITANFLSL